MRPIALVAALLILLAAMISAQQRASRPSSRRKAVQPTTIVYGGELMGYLSPCGCAKPMLGGMARRAAALRRLARTHRVLAVENGDLVAGTARQDEIKAETLVDMCATLGYSALAVGERDARLGAPFLVSLRERANGRMICANLLDGSGTPLFAGMRSGRPVSTDRGSSVAIGAVLSPGLVPKDDPLPDGMTISDPHMAVRRLAPELRGGVLLYHGPRAEAVDAARQAPGIAVVVYAHATDTPAPPLMAGQALLVCPGAKGKHLGVARIAAGARATMQPVIALTESVGEDRAIATMYRDYQRRVGAENLLALMPRYPMAAGSAFAGSSACSPCHASAYEVWARSKHASAMATLSRAHSDRDPECVPCHAVGPNLDGGYRPGDSHLAHVGCESCHGASGEHSKEPTSPKRPRPGRQACSECHVPEHSPGFRLDAYWPRIAH